MFRLASMIGFREDLALLRKFNVLSGSSNRLLFGFGSMYRGGGEACARAPTYHNTVRTSSSIIKIVQNDAGCQIPKICQFVRFKIWSGVKTAPLSIYGIVHDCSDRPVSILNGIPCALSWSATN